MAIEWEDGSVSDTPEQEHMHSIERKYNISPGVLDGVWATESSRGKNLRTNKSSAKGHFQFIDSTAKEYGLKNPDDFFKSAEAAAKYISDMKDRYNGDENLALAAYKAGAGNVDKYGVNAIGVGKNADAGYLKKVKNSGREYIDTSNVVWDTVTDEVDKLKSQLNQFQENYNRENLSGLPQVAAEVKAMPWSEQAKIAAGRAATGFTYGIKDFGNFIADVFGDSNAPNKSLNLEKARKEETRLYRPFEEKADISSQALGGSLPYLVPTPINPLARKVGSEVINAVSSPVRVANRASQSTIVKVADKLSSSSNPIASKVGKKIQTDLVDPMIKNRTARLEQAVLPDPYYADVPSTILGSGIQGAIEGGLNYDTSAGQGAIASSIGTVGGVGLRKLTNRIPDYRAGRPERELLDWYKSRGGKPSWGLDTGSRRLQNFESQLEKSSQWNDAAALYKQENQLIDNKIAYEAMGIEKPGNKVLSPQELYTHLKDLKGQYTELQKNTTAKFLQSELSDLDAYVKEVATSPSKTYKSMAKQVDSYVKAIKNNVGSQRNALGQISTNTAMTGRSFENLRSQLQDEISTAYKTGNVSLAKVLEPVKEKLDTAVERGVGQGHGSATVKQWKDLNSRYAMTHIILEHGMNPSGIDAKKLHTYFNQSEPKNYYLSKGNDSIKELYKLAKVGYLRSSQDTSFGGIRNTGGNTATGVMLGIPGVGMLPGFDRLALSMYKKGIPARYGILGMGADNKFKIGDYEFSMPNFWRGPEVYTRALGQGSQTVPKIYDKASSLYDRFVDTLNTE
jgi:Transglycosylase SLT domain